MREPLGALLRVMAMSATTIRLPDALGLDALGGQGVGLRATPPHQLIGLTCSPVPDGDGHILGVTYEACGIFKGDYFHSDRETRFSGMSPRKLEARWPEYTGGHHGPKDYFSRRDSECGVIGGPTRRALRMAASGRRGRRPAARHPLVKTGAMG